MKILTEEQREKTRINARKWREQNRERHRAYTRAYWAARREEKNRKNQEWNRANPEKAKAQQKAYRERHPDKCRESARKYISKNPGARPASCQKYRARLKGSIGSYTGAEWTALVSKYRGACLCCTATDKLLTPDHVVPLVSGGSNDIGISNLSADCATAVRERGRLTTARTLSEV